MRSPSLCLYIIAQSVTICINLGQDRASSALPSNQVSRSIAARHRLPGMRRMLVEAADAFQTKGFGSALCSAR